ncbi:hypothetical protein EW146_g1700 [Bondarzewia mesenterica]|uniref:RRM domain-containing protein n=1 Tax=Bondarzewia mesenterica TaxID=1095465 RepID=A0A4S4M4G4_9AGAM|nr:hypothetical protein EW146_g1700 [Bondarzewia mesenterica]
MARRLYLGKLPPDTRTDDVSKFFDGYGKIVDCRVMTGKYLPSSCYGKVRFIDRYRLWLRRVRELKGKSYMDAEDAMHHFNGKTFLGSNIVVEFAKESRPRREPYDDRYGAPRSRRPPGIRILVSGISRDTSWQDLKDFGREVGSVSFADIDRDNVGTGILEYLVREDAERAVKELDSKDLRGQAVRVTMPDDVVARTIIVVMSAVWMTVTATIVTGMTAATIAMSALIAKTGLTAVTDPALLPAAMTWMIAAPPGRLRRGGIMMKEDLQGTMIGGGVIMMTEEALTLIMIAAGTIDDATKRTTGSMTERLRRGTRMVMADGGEEWDRPDWIEPGILCQTSRTGRHDTGARNWFLASFQCFFLVSSNVASSLLLDMWLWRLAYRFKGLEAMVLARTFIDLLFSAGKDHLTGIERETGPIDDICNADNRGVFSESADIADEGNSQAAMQRSPNRN